ncbi:MAG: nucleotidyltransferase domain-containing protein [Acidobacteriota bacterium]|nr:nucleotidyltransferase domain-containing protein [Acidobacteriota bacterium]
MFTPEYRTQLRSELLEYAANDKRLAGAAVTGSAAANREDQWSDIDLAFGIADPEQVAAVLSDFTGLMYEQHAALHHYDVRAGAWIYRVFFLPGTLQIDLAFVAQSEFRPLGPTFKLIFGKTNPIRPTPQPVPRDTIGLAWLHALHARSCILRGKFWQAEYMISAVRDHVMALACIRLELPPAHGRGMDLLPRALTAPLLQSLVRELDSDELWRALGVTVHGLATETSLSDPVFGARIAAELSEIASRPASASL